MSPWSQKSSWLISRNLRLNIHRQTKLIALLGIFERFSYCSGNKTENNVLEKPSALKKLSFETLLEDIRPLVLLK